MKCFSFVALLCLAASSAMAVTPKQSWNSAPLFIGQTNKTLPNGQIVKAETWYPVIMSTQPDGSGYYEVWYQSKPYYQESYADHKALTERKACNYSQSNSCVEGQPQWHEILNTSIFVNAKVNGIQMPE